MGVIYSCVPKCHGCEHQLAYNKGDFGSLDTTCEIYMRPHAKWTKLGGCEGATHIEREVKTKTHSRIGQQKQKKGR